MQVTITKGELRNDITPYTKAVQKFWDNHGATVYIAADHGGNLVLKCEVAYTKSGTAHAVLWLYSRTAEGYTQGWSVGVGKAGGYGYCKTSTAVENAIESAGFKLEESISGRGESLTREALRAIARHIAPNQGLIFLEV